MPVSYSGTSILIQYSSNGAHNSAALTSPLGYYKGHLGMRNYTMLPTHGDKSLFLNSRDAWHR